MGEAPAPLPRSPPRYPDLCGRRRLQLEVHILNREVGFLEQEIQGLERIQPVSRCCKDAPYLDCSNIAQIPFIFLFEALEDKCYVNEFVSAKPDPMIPVSKRKHGSCTCSLFRWIRSKLGTCFSCLCCGCHCLPKPKAASCFICSCCACRDKQCCTPSCSCPKAPSCSCTPGCGGLCRRRCSSCADCSCSCAGCLAAVGRCLSCLRPSCCKCQSSCCEGEPSSCRGKGGCCGGPAVPSCPECSCGCVCSCPRCTGGCRCPPCGTNPCCAGGCLC